MGKSIVADLTIEMLADENAGLREDIRTYRELAVQAIHRVYELQRLLDRLRDQQHRLVDEYRAVRVQILREAA